MQSGQLSGDGDDVDRRVVGHVIRACHCHPPFALIIVSPSRAAARGAGGGRGFLSRGCFLPPPLSPPISSPPPGPPPGGRGGGGSSLPGVGRAGCRPCEPGAGA